MADQITAARQRLSEFRHTVEVAQNWISNFYRCRGKVGLIETALQQRSSRQQNVTYDRDARCWDENQKTEEGRGQGCAERFSFHRTPRVQLNLGGLLLSREFRSSVNGTTA